MKYLPQYEFHSDVDLTSNVERFVSINERKFISLIHEFPPNYVAVIRKGKREKFKWKNLSCIKDPMTLSTYQQLFQEVKPKTVLEFGTHQGGSALWISDILNALKIKSKVYTFDKENDDVIIDCENIETITWDVYNIKEYVKNNLDFFKSLEHPILVIDDCHLNLCELFSEIDQFLLPGEYIIVEDTNEQYIYDQMTTFLNSKKYLIDTYYCDFWGLNNSFNINSYLVKQ